MKTWDEVNEQALAYVRERYPFDEDTQQFQDMVYRVALELRSEAVPVAEAAVESFESFGRVVTRASPAVVPVWAVVLGGIVVGAGVWWALKKWGPGS